MGKLRQFRGVARQYGGLADFRLVYIQEAHASDGWSIRNNYHVGFHRTLQDRLSAAQILADSQPPCPLLVDNMADEANKKYGVVNERLYIVLDGRVVYKGRMGPSGYSVQEVVQWLEAYQQSMDNKTN